MNFSLEKKKILILLIFLVVSLLFRELPYVNVLVAGKLWIFYGILFTLLIVPWKLQPRWLIFTSGLLLFSAFLFTLGKLYLVSELLGIGIYFLLWIAVVLKIIEFIKSLKPKN